MIDLTKVYEIKNVLSNKVIDSIEDEFGNIIYEAWKKLSASGTPPLTLNKCKGVDLLDYKIYGNSVQESILPSDYQQLDYIEADGTQYLEINYKASNKTNSKGVFQITDTNVAGMLFGARQETNTKTYGFNWGGGAPFKYYNNYYGATMYALSTVQINKKRHSFEKQANKLYLDDKLIHTREDTDGSIAFTTPTNICVFACNTNGTIHAFASVRIFSLQFYNEDVLKIDLIPCYRKSDDEVGLYDLVNNVFYTNKGTGELIKGINVPTQDKPFEIESVGELLLPNEYQEVEYIESTGTQYIDMKYKYNINDEINIEFAKTQNTGAIQGVFGNGNLSTYTGTVLYINAQNLLVATIGGILGSEFYRYETPIKNNVRYRVKYKGNKVYLDNKEIITVPNAPRNGTQEDFSLFRRWGTNGMYGRIYNFSIKRDNSLIFEFVPCYRKSDNVIGIYDLINNVFYENTGTGTFLKGNDKTSYKIPVKVSGKNLFEIKSADKRGQSAYYGYGETKYDLNEDGYTLYSYTGIAFNFDDLEVGEKYTLSVKFENTLESGRFFHIGQNMYQNNTGVLNSKAYSTNVKEGNYLSLTFTADKTNLLAFALQYGTGSLTITDIQLEKGEKRTDYEEYIGSVTTNIYIDEPLRRMGDYADYIDFKQGKVIKKIAKHTFDGTEEWIKHTTTNEGYGAFRNENLLTPLIGAPISASYMTHFSLTDKGSTADFLIGEYRFTYISENLIGGSRLYVSAEQTTVEEFKEWLANNKPTIYYAIEETPEEIELPNIPTLKGNCILSVDTKIQPSNAEVIYMGKS